MDESNNTQVGREAVDALARERYISLVTYKKSGDEVRTPVWVVRKGDHLLVWTGGDSYKVKRLRNNPAFKAAACNASGKKILGPWYEGKARIIEDADQIAEGRGLLKAKYGWQVTVIGMVNRLRGHRDENVVLLELSF